MTEQLCTKCGYPIENSAGTCFRCNTGMPPNVPGDNTKMSPEKTRIQDLEAVCGTQAAKIERLKAERGVMRAALDLFLNNAEDRYDSREWMEAKKLARRALASDAGKAAADVLAAAVAYADTDNNEDGFRLGQALFEAVRAYRKEGRDDA